MAKPITPAEDRLWAKVEIASDLSPNGWSNCWLWTGALKDNGYAAINYDGKAGGRVYIHRLAYTVVVGAIPAGFQIDHLCRRRHCVNPAHLEPVTPLENTRRGSIATKTHCKRGHPLSGENLYRGPRDGRRQCRICRRMHSERHRST